ncbi:hypothetical protein [Chromobacterium piscinae]|uniref:hypothetical protein n=1 Tax=Chromobacterium piscinae TaxID=686831 RepID=UPI0031FCC22C
MECNPARRMVVIATGRQPTFPMRTKFQTVLNDGDFYFYPLYKVQVAPLPWRRE